MSVRRSRPWAWGLGLLAAVVLAAVVVLLVRRPEPYSPDLRGHLRDRPAEGARQPTLEAAVRPRAPIEGGAGAKLPTQPQVPTGTVEGVLLDAETEQPVAEGLVYASFEGAPLRLDPAAAARSDATGRFVVPVATDREGLWLEVRAAGYLGARHPLPGAAAVRAPVRIPLARGGRLRGRVVSPAGEPIPGATVWATGPGAFGRTRLQDTFRTPGGSPPPTAATATTDARGAFELSGLGAEPLRVRASKPGWVLRPGAVPPPRSSRQESLPLLQPTDTAVRAGAEDVRLVMQPVWALAFVVEDAETGQRLEHARVSWIGDPGAGGRFQPSDTPDADWFTGAEPAYAARRAYFVERSEGAAPPAPMLLRIAAVGYEDAELQLEPRAPSHPEYLQPQRVGLRRTGSPGVLRLVPKMGGTVVRGPLALRLAERHRRAPVTVALRPAPEGQHLLRLAEGAYRVTVAGLPSFETLDAPYVEFTVEAGRETVLELDLRAGQLDLDVRDPRGRPLDASRLRITSNDAFARSWLLGKTESLVLRDDAEGERLEPLPPGLFSAYLQPGSYSVRAGCHGFRDRDFPNVLISDGQRTRLDVVLEEAGE